MEIAKIKVDANRLTVQACEILTAGLVGATVEFDFSAADWDGLQKTAVFKTRKESRDVAMITAGAPVAVPWEVLDTPGVELMVGVYGATGSGEIVVPTVWGSLGKIRRGATPSKQPPQPPTPSWPEQIEEAIQKNADDLEKHAKDQENPHQVTAAQAGAIPASAKGTPGGVATLGDDGKVPREQLPDGGGGTTFTPGAGILLQDGVLSVDTADAVEQDNTLPVTSAAVFVEVGNIDALLSQI